MSATFNLQTSKKEDMSVRLRTHDLKRAKNETKKLEKEGKKMEERLMELKLAMNREKEERERQGGGFWKTGQSGTLNNYADAVLTKKKNKSASSGKGKIKILKDKPLDLPDRSNQPGTMAFIAQKGSTTPRDKPKGPKCGQCEERSAAVSCMQCSEDYCAGCFAAFHLKGNLKKHRSVPLTATPRQCFASPRPNPAQTSGSYDFDDDYEAAMVPAYQRPNGRHHDRNSPEGASGTYENSLLNGTYNEAEQAASFQEALNAWRGGGKDGASESSSNERSHRTPRPVSRVMTPTVNVDTSTGTQQDQQEIEIKFSNNISYADRLLLKQHRRTDVDALFTPRSEANSVQNTPRYSARGSARNTGRKTPATYREMSNLSMKMEDFDDFDDEERVNFQALFNAVKSSDSDKSLYPDPDAISIIEVELNESQSDEQVEKSMKYKVQEEGGEERWNTEIQDKPSTQKFEVRPPSSGKSARRKSGRKSSRLNQSTESETSVFKLDAQQANTEAAKRLSDENSSVLGAKLKDVENNIKRERTKTSVRFDSEATIIESERLKSESKTSTKEERPKSGQRSKSEKSRPQSGARSASKQGQSRSNSRQGQQRSNSRQGSRPNSRANSRLGSSRASSRLENPGLLTKSPSEALHQIARMTPTSQPYKGMDSFFMVGVDPAPKDQEERTLTPTEHRDKEGKIKVSYQLYNMAPRSWKPDFSIADSIPVDKVEGEDAEDDRASSVMAYHAYSEMLVSDITERLMSRFGDLPIEASKCEMLVSDITERLMSRFGDLPIEEDSLSDQSIRSLGEEYRTFTPRDSMHNSPIISGKNSPVQISKSLINNQVPTPRKSVSDPSVQTPRQSARSRAQTPKAMPTQKSARTPRRSQTFHENVERPMSRAIVMEGTDLSIFDNVGVKDNRDNEDEETLDQLEWELASQTGRITDLSIFDNVGVKDNRDNEDEETLDQLEWELASQTGRITAEGKISRMEILDDHSDDSLNSSLESVRSLSRMGQDQGYDINNRLRKDELEEENALFHASDDESDVRNLM